MELRDLLVVATLVATDFTFIKHIAQGCAGDNYTRRIKRNYTRSCRFHDDGNTLVATDFAI